MSSRRTFLKLAGGTGVILAAGGTGFALTRTPTKALEPWTLAGSAYSEPRMRALSYGLLAPNPHNRQPWVANLSEPGVVTLTCDPDRLLAETDPPNRQITIGLGCFIELARMAAAEEGTRLEFIEFPEGEPQPNLDGRPIARLIFHPGEAEPDPLFAQVLARRSNKEPYDTQRAVPQWDLDRLLTAAIHSSLTAGTVDMALVETIRDIAWRGWMVETTTERTYMESVRLMRIGKAEIEANPDGIDMGGAFLEAMSLAGVLTRETLADPDSFAFKTGIDMYQGLIGSAMGFVYVTNVTNSRADQLRAGYDWVRLNLKATKLGIAIHPLSQVLQEFPEMNDLYREIHETLGITQGRNSNVG